MFGIQTNIFNLLKLFGQTYITEANSDLRADTVNYRIGFAVKKMVRHCRTSPGNIQFELLCSLLITTKYGAAYHAF